MSSAISACQRTVTDIFTPELLTFRLRVAAQRNNIKSFDKIRKILWSIINDLIDSVIIGDLRFTICISIKI